MSAKKSVTKTATKKVAAKKVAAKKTAKRVEQPAEKSKIFSILDTDDSFSESAGSAMRSMLERRKGREVGFSTQAELQMEMLPVRPISFQWMINSRCIRKCITNILARDSMGKSTLVYNLFGGFMLSGYPCAFIPCEGKPLETDWAMRSLSSDLRLADKMASRIHVFRSHLLAEMAEKVEAWLRALRDPKSDSYVPASVPVVLAIDPIGRLATNAQAAGISTYDGKEKQKQIEIGDKGHSWDRAKWLHDWVNSMILLSNQFNAHTIIVEHQNEKDPAGGGSQMAAFMPQWKKELDNRTKSGGQGINQVTNLQLTLAEKGKIYSAGECVARRIIMTPYKNSYGPQTRTCCYALKLEPGANGEDEANDGNYLDPGLRWDYPEVEWLAEHGLLGFRKTGDSLPKERFSSDVLNFTQLSLVDAAQAWREADPSLVEELGAKLKIPGYTDLRGRILGELEGGSDEA